MADWLGITNTIINYETLQKVNALSYTQQLVTNQVLSADAQKQKDNAFLSQLVDLLVKVRKFTQDRQYLDALFSAGLGIVVYNQIYSQIIGAESKLKASDIQIELLESMRSLVSVDSINNTIRISLSRNIIALHDSLVKTLDLLHPPGPNLVRVTPNNIQTLQIEDELVPVQNVINLATKVVMFSRGKSYKIIEVDPPPFKAFHLTNDFGTKWHLGTDKGGGAELFSFFDQPLPSLDKELLGWDLCNKIFGKDFTSDHLNSIHTELIDIYRSAFDHSPYSMQDMSAQIAQYKEQRSAVIQDSLNNFAETQRALKLRRRREVLEILKGIGTFVLVVLAMYLKRC